MSWFSSSSTPAQGAEATFESATNFWPVTSTTTGFGELSDTDTAWGVDTSHGFRSEVQVWYSILEDGSLLLCQVIWSYLGVYLVPGQAQMTFKIYNPKTKKQVWRSVNCTGFTLGADKRSCKSNEFEIKHTGSAAAGETESYAITASLDKTVQISVTFTRPAGMPGFKYGPGESGGYSSFGKDKSEAKRDGIVIHKFLPFLESSGTLVIEGNVVDAKGDATFNHAIQGMRPNNVATRWNFAYFTTGGGIETGPLGKVRAVQMEFETTDDYGAQGPKSGRIKCNLGAIYSSSATSNPMIVVGQTHPGGYPALNTTISKATHTGSKTDSLTGYPAPTGLKFEWEGESRDGKGIVKADVEVKTGAEVEEDGGLIEKVDVLVELPYLLRKALSAAVGIKPYIFQYLNEATLNVTLPGEEAPTPVKGWMFNEATFISM